jgi:hypothetical protein
MKQKRQQSKFIPHVLGRMTEFTINTILLFDSVIFECVFFELT